MTIGVEHVPRDDQVRRSPRRANRASATDTLVRVEILVTLLLSALALLAIVHLAGRVAEDSPPRSQSQPRGIVWGGQTFVNLASFARWLRGQGYDYSVWAHRHPRRAGLPEQVPAAPRKLAAAERPDNGSSWAGWALAGAALVFVAAVIGAARRRRWWQRMPRTKLPAKQLGAGARFAVAKAAGAGWMLLRLTAAGARETSTVLRLLARAVLHRRGELAWYLTAVLLAAATGLAVVVWA